MIHFNISYSVGSRRHSAEELALNSNGVSTRQRACIDELSTTYWGTGAYPVASSML